MMASDADTDTGTVAVDCQGPDDLYGLPARDIIGSVARRFLDENALTATEVLHSVRHQAAIMNVAGRAGMVQQAERLLAERLLAERLPAGRLPAERLPAERTGPPLAQLVEEAARLTRQRLKDLALPELTPASYPGFAADAQQAGGRFAIDAGLTAHLTALRSLPEKIQALLALATHALDADAMAPIDRLLGEMLRSETAMATIVGLQPFATTVEWLASTAVGDEELPEEAPAELRALQALVRRQPMPGMVEGLMVSFRRELRRPERFNPVNPGDLFGIETIQLEALSLSGYAGRLRDGEAFRGGPRTEAALQRRMGLLINEETIPQVLKGRSFINRLRLLFMIQRMPLSATSAAAVNTYLGQYFDGRDLAGRLLDCWKERAEKLRGLAEVQKMVCDSTFPLDVRTVMAGQVDDIQSGFIRTQRLLAPLAGSEEPMAEIVVDLIKLAGEGAFCQGKSRNAVAKLLHRHVHRPGFIRSFLLGGEGGFKERLQRTQWLREALAVISVPFVDLSTVRALVVDDEEGPRLFVTSVLKDLGITEIATACDGQEALDRIAGREDLFDLIVCDWMMPRVSGLDLLKSVRDARPDLPFLMVTGLATRKAVEKALSHRVSGYIAKPFTPEQLEEKVLLMLTQKAISLV
jgi:CheY-like chemotaxis protein